MVRGTCALSLTLFVAACATPAAQARRVQFPGAVLEFSDRNDPVAYRGWAALAAGWVVALAELGDANGPRHPFNAGGLAWLANPLWLAGVILLLCRRSGVAVACGWLGVGLGAVFLVSPAAEQGRPVVPLVGAYVWVGSLAVFAAGASAARVLGWRRPLTRPAEPGAAADPTRTFASGTS